MSDEDSDMDLAQPLQEYVLNVLAQEVVADSCCCCTFNISDLLQSSQLSRLEFCTVYHITEPSQKTIALMASNGWITDKQRFWTGFRR
jgi:hypothetical protein